MSEAPGELTPIKPARVAQELARLSAEFRAGEIKNDMYDQRFARMIQELRARRIDGGRAEVLAALQPLVQSGEVTEKEQFRLLAQLGMK
ncbi:MAG: hypothetical protein OEV95_05190 [Gemmatimonadota bacterium]|nr:hypothetical protein [Gemmatimonadota bacterium]MDH5284988.1 hypothetical protein [Gemmatimonadota bacterium]